MRTFLRRLKGAAVNAAFWGVTWFGIGFMVEDVSPLRFALGGALVTMLIVLVAGTLMNFGQMVDDVLVRPWGLYAEVVSALLVTGGLGGATAYGAIKLAQRGADFESLEAGSDRLLPDG
jgi:hypothetical protein